MNSWQILGWLLCFIVAAPILFGLGVLARFFVNRLFRKIGSYWTAFFIKPRNGDYWKYGEGVWGGRGTVTIYEWGEPNYEWGVRLCESRSSFPVSTKDWRKWVIQKNARLIRRKVD